MTTETLQKVSTVYLIKGTTCNPDGDGPDVPDGTLEWQFSDGPRNIVGREEGRSWSDNYLDLKEGLEKHRDCYINIDEAEFTPEEKEVYMTFIESKARTMIRVGTISEYRKFTFIDCAKADVIRVGDSLIKNRYGSSISFLSPII